MHTGSLETVFLDGFRTASHSKTFRHRFKSWKIGRLTIITSGIFIRFVPYFFSFPKYAVYGTSDVPQQRTPQTNSWSPAIHRKIAESKEPFCKAFVHQLLVCCKLTFSVSNLRTKNLFSCLIGFISRPFLNLLLFFFDFFGLVCMHMNFHHCIRILCPVVIPSCKASELYTACSMPVSSRTMVYTHQWHCHDLALLWSVQHRWGQHDHLQLALGT